MSVSQAAMMRACAALHRPGLGELIADRDLPPRAVLTLLSLSLDRSAAADAALYPIGWRSRDLSMIDGIGIRSPNARWRLPCSTAMWGRLTILRRRPGRSSEFVAAPPEFVEALCGVL